MYNGTDGKPERGANPMRKRPKWLPSNADPGEPAVTLSSQDLHAEADRILAEAVSSESMRHNPYKGKPLDLQSSPYDQGTGTAYRILKNSGHRLPWMDLEDEIKEAKAALAPRIDRHVEWLSARLALHHRNPLSSKAIASIRTEHDRFVAEIAQQVQTLRSKIETFNLSVPILERQMMNIRPHTYVRQIEERAAPILQAIEQTPTKTP